MNFDTPMSTWYVLTLAVHPDQAEWIADRIRERFAIEPVQLERPGGAQAWVEIYFEREDEIRPVEEALKKECPILASAVRTCDSRDWQAFWQLHFKARNVGKRLRIVPAWELLEHREPDRRTLRIVPGLSFGTGEHFSTRFCLEMIDRLAPPGPCRSMWDVGCGSGILGVAGALLDMDSVLGTDNDAVCLTQAAENAALNGVRRKTTWRQADITEARDGGESFDLVCANLFANLLMETASVLWPATGRYLVLSGIREFEVDAVAETFIRFGAQEVVRDGDGDWAGLLFARA